MSRICEICGKGYQRAKLVPRGIGNRVTKRTTTKKMPNLRSKRFDIGDRTIKVTLCASCLKRFKKEMTVDLPVDVNQDSKDTQVKE